MALTLYAAVRVVVGIAAFALRVWPLGLLQMVQHHRDLLERRTHHVLVWAAIMGWVARTLDHVGLFQPALSLGEAVLAAKLGRGSIQITPRDMLEFVLTVWLAYLVSTFIRFVLREDVYPHTRLTRGISYAISSLLNYVIIALGFLLALGALGLDLTKVTVLAGAFGVGIGFGLQSIVNNFVSGLILLFERPVHVGDIVEVGDISGEVSRIGIRASTLRTWQGAEVIVPNAQLVTSTCDQLDALRPDAPHRPARGCRLWQRARQGRGRAPGGGPSAPADHADAPAPGASSSRSATARSISSCAPGRTASSAGP